MGEFVPQVYRPAHKPAILRSDIIYFALTAATRELVSPLTEFSSILDIGVHAPDLPAYTTKSPMEDADPLRNPVYVLQIIRDLIAADPDRVKYFRECFTQLASLRVCRGKTVTSGLRLQSLTLVRALESAIDRIHDGVRLFSRALPHDCNGLALLKAVESLMTGKKDNAVAVYTIAIKLTGLKNELMETGY